MSAVIPQPVRFVRSRTWEDLNEEQVVERYLAGASLDDLGMVTGTSGYRVRKVLVAHGVTIRPARRYSGPNPAKYVRKP